MTGNKHQDTKDTKATRFMYRHYLKTLSLCSSCLGVFFCIAFNTQAQTRAPNIILIMADDLGRGHCGCYGQTKIRTPNIDRIAAEGMKFNQFYTGANVCAPSRSVLMTGLHTGHTPVRNYGMKRFW